MSLETQTPPVSLVFLMRPWHADQALQKGNPVMIGIESGAIALRQSFNLNLNHK